MADDTQTAAQDSEQDFAIPGQDPDTPMAGQGMPAAPQGGAQAPPAAQSSPVAAPSAPAAPSGDSSGQPQASGKAMFLGNLLKTILSGVQNSGGNPNNAFDRGFQNASPQAQQQRSNKQQMDQAQISKAQSEADLEKMQVSLTGMKALQTEYLLKRLPQEDQMKHLETVSNFKQALIKEGASVEAEGDDEKASDAQAQQLNGSDPRATGHAGRFYSLPTMDSEGKAKFDVVYVPTKDVLQNDYKYTDANGKEQSIPAGTPMSGAMGKFVENLQKGVQDDTKAQHKQMADALKPNVSDNEIPQTINWLENQQKQNTPLYQRNKAAADAQIKSLQAAHTQNIAEKQQLAAQKAQTAHNIKDEDQLVIAGEPGKQETQVFAKNAVPAGMTSYPLKDPQALASTVARFNDVQTKVNELADFVNKGGMDHIQPGLVGDAIAEANKEMKLGAFGAEMPTARVNAILDQENYKAMNQQSRDFVRNYAFAREAMTQLPAIQTFGKSNRINDTQLKAALQLLPDHKMAGNTEAAKQQMQALQRILDPLRNSIPKGLPGAVMTPSFLEKNQ